MGAMLSPLSVPRYATCNIHDRQGASLKGGREETADRWFLSWSDAHTTSKELRPFDRNVENRIEVSDNGKKKQSSFSKAITNENDRTQNGNLGRSHSIDRCKNVYEVMLVSFRVGCYMYVSRLLAPFPSLSDRHARHIHV